MSIIDVLTRLPGSLTASLEVDLQQRRPVPPGDTTTTTLFVDAQTVFGMLCPNLGQADWQAFYDLNLCSFALLCLPK